MSKKNEDGVEGFFRKAANQSDNSFMAEDWQKMEKMLDARFSGRLAMKRRRIKRTVISGVAISALLLSIYFVSFRSDQTLVGGESSAEQKQAAVVPKQDVHPENPTAALLLTPGISNEKEARTIAKGNQDRVNRKTQEEINPASPFRHQGISKERQPYNEASQRNFRIYSPDSPHTKPLIVLQTESNAIVQSGSEKSTVDEQIVTEEDDQAADSMATPVVEEVFNDEPQRVPVDEREIFTTSRWSVNILVAPDFSTTALSRYSAPGTSIGLLIGFQLGKRFIVHSGASYNFKRYEGYGDEYRPPTGYWERRTNGIIPDEIQGRCQVLEIPLILQYSILQSDRSRLFVGAGLASYIMLDEKYDYAFNTPNPGAADGWSSESSTSYPWAVGDFSVGYDRQLSPTVSIGIEPFMKVPFGKIGWSNITLYTTGININMRYRFVKRTPSTE